MFKKFLSIFLGFLIFLFPSPRASAKIEVVEFSDGSKLIRCEKNDLQDVIDYYEGEVSDRIASGKPFPATEVHCELCEDNPKLTCARSRARATMIVFAIIYMLSGVSTLLLGITVACDSQTSDVSNTAAPYYIGAGIGCTIGCIVDMILYCWGKSYLKEYSRVSADSGEAGFWMGLQDIESSLISMRDDLRGESPDGGSSNVEETRPLLRGGDSSQKIVPDYFLALYRPHEKLGYKPYPFAINSATDTAEFPTKLNKNKFAGLLHKLHEELRSDGVIISNRYYFSKVGTRLRPVYGRVIPELDNVEVVVDSGEDEDPDV